MFPRWYNAVWRWHFYAALFCVPFVIWLSCTGSLYLWRPQIESWLDRSFDHLKTEGALASPDAQVAAAMNAVPRSAFVKYQIPETSDQAVRVLVSEGGTITRVYVDPRSLAVLKVVPEEERLFRVIFHLHGELLAGSVGSYIVEIAACWTIVMLITGIYLWWPRGRRGLAGVVYPRLRSGGRVFWRDLHATVGLWASLFAIVLILTGLPWAKGWGTYLAEIRQLTGTARGSVDWSIGGKNPAQSLGMGDHMGHMAADGSHHDIAIRSGEMARVIAAVRPLGLAPPVLVSPPSTVGAPWSAASDAANRPLRSTVKVDGATGRVIDRKDFGDRHWIDRVIGYGVAVHEGALFGLANQIVGTLTALFLVMLAVSGVVMWWQRRPQGSLGAPRDLGRPKAGMLLVTSVIVLAVYMPMFALTLILVIFLDAIVLRRMGSFTQWIGLAGGPSAAGSA